MNQPLRVLIIEDSENDAILLLRELKRSGYAPIHEQVDIAADMRAALEKQEWDIIISDFVMPQFSGLEALKLLQGTGLDIPFIVVSGKIGEDTAVAVMKAGASDYIMKDNLTRLVPAIEREMQEAAIRRERRKSAEALRQREEELSLMKKVDQLKDEFIGLVSHELRTPVTVILGALNTVLSEGEKLSQQETKQLIEDAYQETETLSNILANLLELARVQANRLELLEEPIDMKEFICTEIDKMGRQATTHEFAIDCRGSLMVTADRVRVKRILLNLLDNAVKYSPLRSTIRVLARRRANEIVIGVCDQGIGISAEDQKRLFKPFQRLGTPDNKVGGTGLGLVVCQRLVEAQGGRIWVESQPGQGSAFYFTLPTLDMGSYRTKKA